MDFCQLMIVELYYNTMILSCIYIYRSYQFIVDWYWMYIGAYRFVPRSGRWTSPQSESMALSSRQKLQRPNAPASWKLLLASKNKGKKDYPLVN